MQRQREKKKDVKNYMGRERETAKSDIQRQRDGNNFKETNMEYQTRCTTKKIEMKLQQEKWTVKVSKIQNQRETYNTHERHSASDIQRQRMRCNDKERHGESTRDMVCQQETWRVKRE